MSLPILVPVPQVEFTYRGKTVDGVEIDFIKQLIAENPGLSRRRLSAKLCLAWNWVQANGHPRDMHLKYVYSARGRPIACMAWSSSPRHLGARDRFIGWTAEKRRSNIRFLAYNTRFLILPWVRVPHLASHLLARTARVISNDWQELYRHPIHLLETFIDPERFKGTCYRSANWIRVGRTTGRGKDDQTNRANRSLKDLWVYPLSRDFRRKLSV